MNKTSTILVEPSWLSKIDIYGNVEISHEDQKDQNELTNYQSVDEVPLDPIELSIFGHRFMSIAEQMGVTL